MPIHLPGSRRKIGKRATQSPVPMITIALILGAWVGLIIIAGPKGQAWASLTAPFR